MGDQYIKANGAWQLVSRPYVKSGGVWTPVQESWVKRSGSWVKAYNYDRTPPQIPELRMEIIDNRYIQVGVRLPSNTHDPDLARIRVHAAPDVSPTSQFGTGGISTKANNWPAEGWSNWYYNGSQAGVVWSSDHGPSGSYTYKNYPVNPTSSTNLPGGKYYYFSAWSVDFDGNWSAGVFTRIWMPKNGTKAANYLVKEANYQAYNVGTLTGGTFVDGTANATASPVKDGLFYYGGQLTVNIGQSGTPSIQSAKIRVSRSSTDAGSAQAPVKVGWHTRDVGDALTNANFHDITSLGTIQKGEAKWFDLPSSWYSHFSTEIHGIGLVHGSTFADDVSLNDLGSDLRCGEINVIWTEDL